MRVGEIQTLKVNRISDFGLYLVDDQEQEVLLPNRFVSLGNAVGDEIEVSFGSRVLKVRVLSDKEQVGKANAQLMYEVIS